MRKADVVVVGGGPAGSSAAALLAREGYSVALFDRAVFPRDKPCGEFLNPGACDLLGTVFGLRFEEILKMGGSPVSQVRLQLPTGDSLEIPMVDQTGKVCAGVSIPRVKLDAQLLAEAHRAGAHTFQGNNVREAVRTENGLVVRGSDANNEPFECETKLVIAADGTHSVIARNEGLTRPIKRLASIGIVAHLKGLENEGGGDINWMFPSNGNGVLFGVTRQPGNTAVLSAAVPKRFARQIASHAEGFVGHLIAAQPALSEEIASANVEHIKTVPCFGHFLTRPFAEGMLFLGDAARFVDPFTGEGIHHALESALLAARTASRALESGDFSLRALSGYQRDRAELGRRYLLCDLVRAVCVTPSLMNLIGRRLRSNPLLARTLVGAIVDALPPDAVFNSKFVFSLGSPHSTTLAEPAARPTRPKRAA